MNLRVPVSWLREYLKTDVNTKTIANYLTLSGPSVERIEKLGDDFVFDVEVTTNRPDAFSVFGLAREANAILNSENQKSQIVEPKGLSLNLEPDTNYQLPLDVIIKNQSLCPRFTAIVIDNVKIKSSPAIIKNRLQASGIRAINNIVDISNYIMLELGQPMHTFDYDKIKGSKMTLRESKEGEKIETIDGQIRKLPPGTIVIEDSQRLIDLCGIMGGANSQISNRTKRVVIFVQAYDPITIRKTTQALAFRTEAAARFEKGIDLEGILPALSQAVYLAKQTSGAKIASELIDIFPKKPKTIKINLNLKRLQDYLGVEVHKDTAARILTLLGFKTTNSEQIISAIPPSWRFVDIEQEEDLIEEIARVYGYHKLPSRLPEGQPPDQEESNLSNVMELKKALKYLGLTEVISYSIISKEFLDLAKIPENQVVELANPLTKEWQFMRPTLLVSLTNILAQNLNIKSDISLFEIARTYQKRQNDLPKQDLMLTIILNSQIFAKAKGIVENLLEVLNKKGKWESSVKNQLFEMTASANLKIDNFIVGTVGTISQHIADYFEIENSPVACELNLSKIFQLPSAKLSYKPISKYPPVIEDLSAVFEEKTPIDQILSETEESGIPLVKKVEIIDVFRNEKMGKGKKSITIRITYQKTSGTPTKEEVGETRDKIMDSLIKLGATLRLKLSPI